MIYLLFFNENFQKFLFVASLYLAVFLLVYILFLFYQHKKFIERVYLLNNEQKDVETLKIQTRYNLAQTNHILHLLITFITFTSWLIPWGIITALNKFKRHQLMNKLDVLMESKVSQEERI